VIAREIHLVSRPTGLPTLANFALVESPLAPLGNGQILVRNLFLSVDPYMRGRMSERPSYIAPFRNGAALDGAAVGVVLETRDPAVAVGDLISHFSGWCDHAVVDASSATIVDTTQVPIEAYLGALGLPGHAAYYGLTHIAQLEGGQTVFISAAGGAVGSIAAQIAMLEGCRVIGSVGSEDKLRWLRDEIGLDAVINYQEVGDLVAALRIAAPNGIDAYFDNVGGAHLEAAIAVANDYARFALCGMVGQYNSAPTGPANIYQVVEKSLVLRGFIGINYPETWPAFTAAMTAWLVAPAALIGLFSGENVGKMLVRLVR
jgi:NADPH-dependent curcumin reductase CurA